MLTWTLNINQKAMQSEEVKARSIYLYTKAWTINRGWELCIPTYHIDASGVFQAAHPLQRCHSDSCPLEDHTAVGATQTHTHITRNQLALISSLLTFRLHGGCTLIAQATAVQWPTRRACRMWTCEEPQSTMWSSWQLSLSIQKQNQALSDESKQNRPFSISTAKCGANNSLLMDECMGVCECQSVCTPAVKLRCCYCRHAELLSLITGNWSDILSLITSL